jgi:hypothetical protein
MAKTSQGSISSKTFFPQNGHVYFRFHQANVLSVPFWGLVFSIVLILKPFRKNEEIYVLDPKPS